MCRVTANHFQRHFNFEKPFNFLRGTKREKAFKLLPTRDELSVDVEAAVGVFPKEKWSMF